MTYPTLADLKEVVGISDSADDSVLTWALDGAIEAVEAHTRRTFVAVTATKTFRAYGMHVSHNKRVLWLHEDLATITSVINGDGASVTTYSERKDGSAIYALELPRYEDTYWNGGITRTNPISIAGKWGYSEDCPSDVFLAILQLATRTYRSRQTGATGDVTAVSRMGGMQVASVGLSEDVLMVLARYSRRSI
jgi:hypothetical protein